MGMRRQDGPENGPATDTANTAAWNKLVYGEEVSLDLAEGYTLYGQVAEVLADGSAIWIHLFEGRGRQMFCAADGVIITPTN